MASVKLREATGEMQFGMVTIYNLDGSVNRKFRITKDQVLAINACPGWDSVAFAGIAAREEVEAQECDVVIINQNSSIDRVFKIPVSDFLAKVDPTTPLPGVTQKENDEQRVSCRSRTLFKCEHRVLDTGDYMIVPAGNKLNGIIINFGDQELIVQEGSWNGPPISVDQGVLDGLPGKPIISITDGIMELA